MGGPPNQVGGGNIASEYHDPRFAELDAQMNGEGVAQHPALAVRHERPHLNRDVDAFVQRLRAKYTGRIKNRPHAFKKRVLRLIAYRLPPYPRPAGRPRQPRISHAAQMYQQQREEIRDRTRAPVNWLPIALECIPGFQRIKDGPRRRTAIQTLRNSVYARLKRIEAKKPPSRSSRKQTPTSY